MGNYLYAKKGLVGVALITNSIFIGLGQYLEYYVPLISFITNILGAVLSIFAVVIFYYWKEGQRHVEVQIKNEKVEEVTKKLSLYEKIKLLIGFITRYRRLRKEKQYSTVLALQFLYIEYQEEKYKKEEKNALDFILGREVILQRNEYDRSPEK
ncbi:hypothetical protein WMO40_21075 [Bacillaceae bacterium CLA-AA-H227]|uniref:Uncharacterized protein n=1 Tax=Robertmurraya yapensis (ex Hitch et al 2024) TaxID=3133160 RepID=A0ACC6SGJ8_9BACI